MYALQRIKLWIHGKLKNKNNFFFEEPGGWIYSFNFWITTIEQPNGNEKRK